MWFLWKNLYSLRTGFTMNKEISNVLLVKKNFSRNEILKKHTITIHYKQKNYKCDSCGKSFTQSGYLKIHIMTIHEGERNYKCDSCSKSFTRLGTLKRHIKTVHYEGQRNYRCNYCEKYFPLAGSLKSHIGRIHDLWWFKYHISTNTTINGNPSE